MSTIYNPKDGTQIQANPLSKFRSYSYYHVLAVCDTSETADALSLSSDPSVWRHPTGPDPNVIDPKDNTYDVLGEYSVKFVNLDDPTNKNQAQNSTARKGRYCVLINGSTDASLAITRAKWQTVTAAQATIMDQATSIAVEGELEISEPRGVVFLDTIVNCCLALGIDAANAVFVLKTFFIGRPDSVSQSETAGGVNDQEMFINTVEPIRFIAYDISGSFTEAGGQYIMNFVALAYGVARMPQYSKAATGFSFNAGSTLAETFQILQDRIQQNYDKLFTCVQETVKQVDADDKTTSDEQKFYKKLARVKYEIELDPHYATNEYVVTDTQPQSKDYPGCDSVAKLTFPTNMSIEDAIHLVMRWCKRVQDEMSTGIVGSGSNNPTRYEYKIHPAYKSEKGSDNQTQHTVRYVIAPFQRPKDINMFDLAAKADGGSVAEELKRNTITFDYIYTGKNIDILEFDMKLNLGMQYLQVATLTNTLKDQLQETPSAFTHVPKLELEQLGRFGKISQVPVLFGTQVKVPSLRNRQALLETTEAGYSLNKHASVEVQDASMKITGNPSLLSSINRVTSPTHMATKPSSALGGVLPSWGTVPSFAKVNVRMPRHNDDIALFKRDLTGAKVGETGYTKEFWFTGYYYVVGIEHTFDNGEFFQTLEMIGIPQSSATKVMTKNGQTQADLERQKQIQSCYGDTIDPCACNQTTGPVQGSQHTLPTSPPNELSYRDAVSVYNGNITPEQVRGYNAAPPDVKAAVVAAANNHKIPPGHLVVIAASESNFKTTATVSSSTAVGLFQFTETTWMGSNKQKGMVNLYGSKLGLNDKPREEQLAARNNPYVSSEAAALLYEENFNAIKGVVGGGYTPSVYDMKLAHMLGGVTAGNVIKYARQYGDATPALTAFVAADAKRGQQNFSAAVKANPDMFGNTISVGEMRAAAARALNKRVIPVQTLTAQTEQKQSPQNTASSTGSQGVKPSSVTPTNQPTNLASSKTSMSCGDKKAAADKSSCNPTQKS